MNEEQENQTNSTPADSPIASKQTTPDTPTTSQQQAANPQQQASAQQTHIGLMILQWLTYAFWGWTVLALSALTTTVIAFFISKADVGGFTPYGIAAILVLLPIAFVCDSFYIKREPVKKYGAEIAITIIHAVIFAIFGVGALIGAVISIVVMFTSSSDSSASLTALISLLIIAFYYSLAFIRTLNIQKISWFNKIYRFIMIVSVGIIALLGILGPVARQRSTRDDRLIESNLGQVNSAINSYFDKEKKLPSNLNQISVTGDAKKIIERNLVTYKPENSNQYKVEEYPLNNLYLNTNNAITNKNTSAKYQLCVNYKESSNNKNRSYMANNGNDEYSYSLSTYDHPAGEVCYKLKTNYF